MTSDDPRVQQLLDELFESRSTPEQVCASCPELLDVVRARWRQIRCLSADLDAMFPSRHQHLPGEAELPQIPGYQVESLLGRGGMGIVFRARHLRLNRPVALKMILSGAYAAPEELERFVQEAEAVANLRHPNIVEVYDAGDFEGRPYFTMELVEGGRLSQKIDGVPQAARPSAELVATLAEAVHLAHQHGIVHRDLKPTNILLTIDGTPKVADFGLARRLEDANGDGAKMTVTGLPVGTPSYMAPEQARGDKEAIGPATDVYALGAILYDLLTGRPPFRGETTAATLQQVTSDEPVPPARLNSRVPRDLATICLKCLYKNPAQRYATARALAEDLRRFQRGEPILARPLGRVGRLARWARRRPTAAALYATLLAAALLALALIGAGLRWSGQRLATARAAEQDLREADGLLQLSNLNLARGAIERARGRLGMGGPPELQQRLAQSETELRRREEQAVLTRKLEQRLEAIRMDRCIIMAGGDVDPLQPDREYEEAFRSASLGPFRDDPEIVAARIKDSPIRASLVAALDDWANHAANSQRRDWLLTVARQADPDPWRNQARNPATFNNPAKLRDLTRSAPIQGQSVQLLVALGERLWGIDRKAAVPFLRQVQREHPDDFYANYWLGVAIDEPGVDVGYFRAALAQRPDAVVANYNVGKALYRQGRVAESIPYFERAVQIDPLNALSQGALGTGLADMGQTDKAIDHLQRSLQLNPKMVWALNNLGLCFERKGLWDKAMAQFQKAMRIDSRFSAAHYNSVAVLLKLGRRDEAIEQCREAVAADPKSLRAHFLMAKLLTDSGRLSEATDQLFIAVALAPTDRASQQELLAALLREGRLEEARAVWRKALDAAPPEHDAWFGYAELCLFLGKEDEYLDNRRELLTYFGGSENPIICERAGRTCLLLPGTQQELHDATAMTDRALAAGRQKLEWRYPYCLFVKGLAEYRLGRWDQAIALMSGEASKATLLGPSPRLITAMALYQKGQKDQARKTLAAAISSYDWSPSRADNLDHWIAHILRREAEAMILPDLPAFLEGKYEPRDNNERLALLGVCQFKDLPAKMAELYAAAFAADPTLAEDLQSGHRYRAACAAAVAGRGSGADAAALSEAQRSRWRHQALQWLEFDLAARAQQLRTASQADRPELQKALANWRQDPDLAGLRESEALDRLPPDECRECRALWSELEVLLAPPAAAGPGKARR